jgi:hypothetical protein
MKTIDVYLNNKSDYINQFHNSRISPELSNYIKEECKSIAPREKFEINIYSNSPLSKLEQQELVNMIRENYGLDVRELYLISDKNKIVSLLCLLFGIMILFVYVLIDIVPILSEIVLIIAWVLIWEAIYNLLFGEVKNKIQIKRLKKLTKCKIVFKK